MKVVCDSCQAKYQVSDERVAGKKLKIRCRKCAATILVRGDKLPAAAVQLDTPPVEQDFQDEATIAVSRETAPAVEWFTSGDGREHGPMSEQSLVSWLIEHPSAWDTHVWREGFGDWVVARYVDSLTQEAESRGVRVDDEAGAHREMDEDAAPTQMRPNALLEGERAFAAGPPSSPDLHVVGGRPVSAPRYEAFSVEPVSASSIHAYDSAPSFSTGPSFGTAASTAYGSGPDVAARGAYDSSPGVAAWSRAQSSPRVSAAVAATGAQRHQESVLFNAAELQRVASPSYANLAPAAASNSRNGYASGDGSGLIDIRALAAMSAASKQSDAAPAPPAVAPILPAGGGLPRLDTLSPVAMPQAAPRSSGNALPLALFGAAVVLAAAIVTVAFVLDTPEPSLTAPAAASAPVAVEPVAPAAAEAPPAPAAEEPAQVAEAAEAEADQPEEEASEEEDSADNGEAEKGAATAAPKPSKSAWAKARDARRRRASAAPVATAVAEEPAEAEEPLFKEAATKPEPDPEPAKVAAEPSPDIDDLLAGPAVKKSEPAKSRSIDDLLNSAVVEAAPAEAKKAAPAPDANLPMQPTRDDVIAAMRAVTPAVQRCGSANGATGVVKVKITVAGSGKVASAQPSDVSEQAASCITQAVRTAKFSAFQKPSFTVNFPFRL